MTMQMPKPGEGWRHYKGSHMSLYEIVGCGIDTESGNAVVVYRHYGTQYGEEKDMLYSRPLSVFLGSTDDHKRRFSFEREAPVVGRVGHEFEVLASPLD